MWEADLIRNMHAINSDWQSLYVLCWKTFLLQFLTHTQDTKPLCSTWDSWMQQWWYWFYGESHNRNETWVYSYNPWDKNIIISMDNASYKAMCQGHIGKVVTRYMMIIPNVQQLVQTLLAQNDIAASLLVRHSSVWHPALSKS